jgi:hypothetical protein
LNPATDPSGRGGGTLARADGIFAPLIVRITPMARMTRPAMSRPTPIGPRAGSVMDPDARTDTGAVPLAFMITSVQSPGATCHVKIAGDPCALATQNDRVSGGVGRLVPGSVSVFMPPGQFT